MAKRFIDTNKYKKKFIRSLPGAYKILWDYLCCECDHAGIWHVDFEVAQIYVGKDMPVDQESAIRLFNTDEDRIMILDGGKKWLIMPFVEFQYGTLNPAVKAHASVLSMLQKEGVEQLFPNSLQRVKDKDTDTDKDIKGGAGGNVDNLNQGSGHEVSSNGPSNLSAKVKIIAHEKSGEAYREFRILIDKSLKDGGRVEKIEDPIVRKVFFELGSMDGIRELINRNGDFLERSFRTCYERSEIEEYGKLRRLSPRTIGYKFEVKGE